MAVTDRGPAPVDESPVIRRLEGPPSRVARPDNPWGMVIAALGVGLLGAIVFSSLSHTRQGHGASSAAGRVIAASVSGPMMPIPNASLATTQVQAEPMTLLPSAPQPAAAAAPDPSVGWKAPAMVVDIGDGGGGGPGLDAIPAGASAPARGGEARLSPDERFDAQVRGGSVETASATRLRDTSVIAPQGTVIPAVTETAINLDLPGYVRAVVSRDVRGFDGSTVLIPKGSHLIGQYRAGAAAGQSRAFVVWSRVLTPAGVSIDIGSPAADRLGEGGIPGETNTHFFRRFGSSILLSILSAGLEAAATSGSNNTTAIVIGSQQQATNIATIALQKDINIPDTVTVAQGTPIRVFVARDLDFSGVTQKAR